jgi:hypothetical protein
MHYTAAENAKLMARSLEDNFHILMLSTVPLAESDMVVFPNSSDCMSELKMYWSLARQSRQMPEDGPHCYRGLQQPDLVQRAKCISH